MVFNPGKIAGFYPYFEQIAKVCSIEGCDTLLFSLWSHNVSYNGAISDSTLFPPRTNHQTKIRVNQK